VTDFRGEPTPQTGFRLFVLQAWAARTYLELGQRRQTEKTENEMAKLNPFKFMQEVRQEVNKVTWPSRKETGITTAMVFVFAALAAVFFLLADQVIRMAVTLVLGIGM
jgi:preprotein translocase subunit SecE